MSEQSRIRDMADRYICPMRCPEGVSDKPGHCPNCGMALVKERESRNQNLESSKHEAHMHDKHAGHTPNMFKAKFWWSLIATLPVLAYSPMVQEWFRFRAPGFYRPRGVARVFGAFFLFFGGLVFLKSAANEIKGRQPGMMTLISLAIISAYFYSVATTFWIQGGEFFWELCTLIVIMLLGHWIEMRSVQSAQGALKELAKLLPDTAELAEGKINPLSELKAGDTVLVRPGGKIPADGKVTDGESEVNESMLTGESKPVPKKINSEVIAGTVNGTGALKIAAAKTGEGTALAGIMRLVAEAQASRSRTQILADRAAFYLTFVALGAGALAFGGWLYAGRPLTFALERLVTVLVIACPHALGLAVPLVTAISTSLGAKRGLLVRQRTALEAARNIDVVLLDKTGTLTLGEPGIAGIWPATGFNAEQVLAWAAAAEAHSEHALGRAIAAAARGKNLRLPAALNFRALPGAGVEAEIDGEKVSVGGPQLLAALKLSGPEELRASISAAEKDGSTIVYVIRRNKIIGALALADQLRAESRAAIKKLKDMNVRVAMLTGDSQAVAASVARELGIEKFFAEVRPENKTEKVRELQRDGDKVMMVGDGVNDAPALTAADVGVAIGAGTDVAIESAGIILMRSDPRDIAKIIILSRATYRKMEQNLFWAAGYNVLTIPLAAGALAHWNINLAPAAGAVLMSLSTVVVALNALLLRRLDKKL